ncbi:MAG: substrate-binding periplasmic protein [Thermodesulfobacteriota bacterium]
MKISRSVMVLAVGILMAIPVLPAAAEQTVTLGTLDWEPYIGQKLENQGWVAEVVREAFKRSGYAVQFQFKPWARVTFEAQKGETDGYFPEYFSEDLKKDFVLSAPFAGGPLGFFKRRGEAVTYTRLEDLKPYKIGVVRGYVNTAEFDGAAYLKKEEAKDDVTNIKKLLAKRLDLIVADKYVGLYLLKQEMPDKADSMEFIEPALEQKDLYVCITKKNPDHEKLIQAFNDGLAKIKADGTLDGIMKRHGF